MDVAHPLLQQADPRLDEPLPLLGGVILGVLAQVAQLARALNLLRQLRLQLAIELVDLVLELLQDPRLHLAQMVARGPREIAPVASVLRAVAKADLSRRSARRARRRIISLTMRRISSRQNPVVARFRDAARRRGSGGIVLLDGEHLVEEALDSGVPLDTVAFTERSIDARADGLVDRVAAQRRERGRACRRAVMAAMSPVREPSGIVAHRADARPPTLETVPRVRPPLVAARGWRSGCRQRRRDRPRGGRLRGDRRHRDRGHRRSVRLEGAPRRDGQHVPGAHRRARSRSAARSQHARSSAGVAIVATVPRGGTPLPECDLREPASRSCSAPKAPGLPDEVVACRGRPRDDPDASAGRVAQRRDHRGADAVRGRAAADDATTHTVTVRRARARTGGRRRARPTPLAERMRPRTLDEFVGQETLLGAGRPLRQAIDHDRLQSIILWGPPGTGKTTLARLIAQRHAGAFRLVQRRPVGHQGNPRGHGRGRGDAGAGSDAARFSSSTRSTGSTRLSRTRSCRASRRATSSSSARRPRTRRSR